VLPEILDTIARDHGARAGFRQQFRPLNAPQVRLDEAESTLFSPFLPKQATESAVDLYGRHSGSRGQQMSRQSSGPGSQFEDVATQLSHRRCDPTG